MLAVAAQLGVDPKAIYYHVRDRETLLSLVAFDMFETEFSKAQLSLTGRWQDAISSYATALREAAAKLGPLAPSVRLRGTQGRASFADVEILLTMLTSAGFDIPHARRILVVISDIAFADVFDVDLIARNEAHPQVADVLSVIDDDDCFPLLRQVVADRQVHPHDDGQFEFHLQAFVAGLEHVLTSAADVASAADPGNTESRSRSPSQERSAPPARRRAHPGIRHD